MLTNLQVAEALIVAWNSGDHEQFVNLFAEDYAGVDVAEPGVQHGRDAIRRSVSRYREGFPDLHLSATATITEDSRVALFWVATGTHRGPLLHIPPTGRPCEVRGVSLLRIDGGRIIEGFHLWDLAALLRGVGMLPELSVDMVGGDKVRNSW